MFLAFCFHDHFHLLLPRLHLHHPCMSTSESAFLVITLLSRDNGFNEFLLLLRILLPWWLKSWAEVNAIDFINHSHWTFTPLRCSRVLPTTHLQRRLNVISASVHRVLAGESSWCLTVVFNDPALVFEYQLRHRFSSREVGLRVFEFAVQVVELQQEKVVLLSQDIQLASNRWARCSLLLGWTHNLGCSSLPT